MKSSLSFSPEIQNPPGSPSRTRLKWAVIIGLWTFFGLLNGSQLYLGLKMEVQVMNVSFLKIFGTQVLGWWSWIPLTPIILLLARRFPLERGTWLRILPIHLVGCGLISAAQLAFVTYISILIAPFGRQYARSFWQMFLGRATSQFHIDLLIYAATLGVSYAVSYYFRFREREFRASQLEAQLVQAQLQTLKMQLQPHFLFNTLNGIAGLVRDSRNKAAVDMIVGLSDLLRYTLENAGKQEVPLKEELEFLELYLDIQQMRFSDRLKVEMQVSPDTLDALVPNLILQPLVENAIRHGISRRMASGTIRVTAGRDGELLRIAIYDDGPGLRRDDGHTTVEGVGLSNTRARLSQLYGEEQGFTLSDREGGGVTATLVIPFIPST